MVSRMEKYYNNKTSNIKKRSQKNVELYDNIYTDSEYSNIEGIATIDKNNEIDITKLKNTIKNRENYKKRREFKGFDDEKEEVVETSKDFVEKEVKNYDIRDILNKAKEKQPVEDSPRSLDNTSYNILKDLKLNKPDKYKDFEDDELKELINTITNTSMLNQMNDEELGLNMFNLESTDEKLESSQTVKQLLEQARKYQENKTDSNLDQSFFTSSLNFSKDDFEDAEGYVKERNNKKIIKRIFIFIGLLIITVGIIVGTYYLIK